MITFFSIVARTPEFIDLQERSIRKHCAHDYRYRVVVNEPDRHLREKIVARCVALGVVYEVFPATYSNPSVAHAEAIQHVWDHCDGGQIAIVDMDICPVYSWSRVMDIWPLAGVKQTRDVDYPWPGFFLANVSDLPGKERAKFGVVLGIRDTGGQFADYMKELALKEDKGGLWKSQPCLWLCQIRHKGFELIDGAWLHCGNGANWKGNPDNDLRIAAYREIVEASLI